ncbi:MAG: hypothetical protein LUH56_06370 [Oscillospiraceae bacterium]|nr:hypothetical protein [Oscillospiraceae bacterium]
MKNLFRLPLSILLALALTISVFASEIIDTPDLPIGGDTEIAEKKDDEKEPDCNPDCDMPVIEIRPDEY